MPTNQEDTASLILEISKKYVSNDKLKEFIITLESEVGRTTNNNYLKETLNITSVLVNPPTKRPPLWLWWSFYALVAFHMAIVLAIITSFCILVITGIAGITPFYIVIPLCVFIFFFSTTRVECQMTNLENNMRKKLGLRQIGGFVGHYLVRPIKRKLLRRQVLGRVS